MAAYILKPIVTAAHEPGWLKRYMVWATWCMKHRLVTMVLATLFFIGSIMLVPLLPKGFIPPDDNSQTQVYVELPPGSTLAQTQVSAEHARTLLMTVNDVKSVYTTIGGGSAGSDPFAGGGAAEVRKATLTIQLSERGTRPRKQAIENDIRTALQQLPGVRSKVATLERLMVPGSRGPVMLGQVASIEVAGGPAVIDRYDRQRNINFEIELSGMPLGDVTAAVQKLPALQSLPPGVKIVEVGDAEVMGELFASFGLAMMIGVLCIYIVLVLLFKGFLHPITILAALPLSLGGAFVGLLIAQKSFSMPSLIGLIMLMGIATKNSILLVEYAIEARRGKPAEGDHPAVPPMSRWDAILDACHKRARPIVMTTIAMGAGMLPIAVGWGAADASFRSPMAIAVIGGLLTSTVLSLLVVPVVFTYLDDLGQWAERVYAKVTRR
jgi:multidrug efflux pump subunit AcrB